MLNAERITKLETKMKKLELWTAGLIIGSLTAIIITVAVGCAPFMEQVQKVPVIATDVVDIIKAVPQIQGVRDWAGIIEKGFYTLAGLATLVTGNELRKRHKRKKESV